jgi:hypothetical protein
LTLEHEDNDNVASTLEAELARLKLEHRDLDTAIDALEQVVTGDQLQIQRLKKRKLVLRDIGVTGSPAGLAAGGPPRYSPDFITPVTRGLAPGTERLCPTI